MWKSPDRRRRPCAEWCESRPEELGDAAKPRFRRLHDMLRAGTMNIRVLPDEAFGLIHGKAGVITRHDGSRTAFLGSSNESGTAFRLNYELLWEDDTPEAVAWVQEEFDALWSSPFAVPLADFVVEDFDRLARRTLIRDVNDWRDEADPASVVVESPVYRKEVGLWEHQKHFVKLAFDAHRRTHGARFVLADQVGLEDVWIDVALGKLEEAKRTIGRVPERHPFELRYHEVQSIDWESCARVLHDDARRERLKNGWFR